MTASPTRPMLAGPISLPDVRCVESLGEPTGRQGRCQLFIGHEPPHAVMFACGDRRIVRTWPRHEPESARDNCTEIARLPWMYGYPVPAWTE